MLKALVFQLLESISLSSRWFQISTCTPYTEAAGATAANKTKLVVGVAVALVNEVGRCKARPRLESAWFQKFNLNEEKRAFKLNLAESDFRVSRPYNEEGRVLLAQRPLHKHMGGKWEFPGGKIDEGESPEQALARECEEELGIQIDQSSLAPITFASHPYDGFNLLLPLYACTRWSGEPRAMEGQEGLVWAETDDIEVTYDMPPADIPLCPPLRRAVADILAAGASSSRV